MSVALNLPLWLLLSDREHGDALLEAFDEIHQRLQRARRRRELAARYQKRFGRRKRR